MIVTTSLGFNYDANVLPASEAGSVARVVAIYNQRMAEFIWNVAKLENNPLTFVDWPLYFQTLFIALPITGSPPQIFPWRTISQCTVRMPFVVMFEGLRKVLCRC